MFFSRYQIIVQPCLLDNVKLGFLTERKEKQKFMMGHCFLTLLPISK